MAADSLYIETEGLGSFAQTHADTVAGLLGLLDSDVEVAGVQATHGPTASSVHAALGGALGARHRSISGVADVAKNLSESLQKAAHAYDQGDQRSAAKLQSAEEAIGDAGVGTGPGGATEVLPD